MLLGLGLIAMATAARAEGRALVDEVVALEVTSSAACFDEARLRADVGVLGRTMPAPTSGARARGLRVDVRETAEATFDVSLEVRNLVGETSTRTTTTETCDDAARAAALFVTLALDEAAAVPPRPAGAEDREDDESTRAARRRRARGPERGGDGTEVQAASRIGSGGVVASYLVGLGAGRGVELLHGPRVVAAVRVTDTTRVGLAGSVGEHRRSRPDDGVVADQRGTSGRVGAVVAWGAPWGDAIAGFAMEVGVTRGSLDGTVLTPSDCAADGRPCFATHAERAATTRWSGGYAGGSLVLQVPWRAPVRPVLTTTCMVVAYGPREVALFQSLELGVVWQAW